MDHHTNRTPSPFFAGLAGSPRGFTLVEMLFVIAVTTLLLAMLFPAVGGAIRAGKRTTEMSHLRQVFYGWQMYGNQNEDAALPGYLEPNVQTAWHMTDRWKLPCGGPDPVPAADAAAYVWRLAPFIDQPSMLLLDYRSDEPPTALDFCAKPANVTLLAAEPAFGYNALHIGGWWEETAGQVRFRYQGTTDLSSGNPIEVVTRRISSIKNTDRVSIFCSSTLLPGSGPLQEKTEKTPGTHYVEPPIACGNVDRWRHQPGVDDAPEALAAGVAAPLGRFGGGAAVVLPDGHTENVGLFDLEDQRRWIDQADSRTFSFGCP